MRWMWLLLILLLPAAQAHAQAPPGARVAQVDTTHYPEVTLYVSVTDASGTPVAGLTAEDFQVTEDGQPVTIARFTGGGASPISAVLVIDHSASMGEEGKLEGARAAARAFVEQMRPGDQTAVIAFDDRPALVQPFTGDTVRLDAAIRRIDLGTSTALYDSLIAGVDVLHGVAGRRALLLLTDGRDCRMTPCINDPASRATLDEAIAYAVNAGIAVQVIGLGDRDTDDLSAGIDERVLRRIADATGGAYFYAPTADQLAQLYRQLSSEMQHEYTLTYRSPRPFYDGTRRDIRVAVSGTPTASGTYVEPHLINVHSDPVVGLVLLVPILAALLLPALLRRRSPVQQPRSLAVTGAQPADGSTIVQPGAIVLVPADAPRCQRCDAVLPRPGARFCSVCGAAQERQEGPARRIFCDQCGRPLRAGARFCPACGASAPQSTICNLQSHDPGGAVR